MPKVTNVEIKARCANPDAVRSLLLERGADHKGTDHQIDTYFRVPEGRLKLRQGSIENNLIFYRRPDQADAKTSHIRLHPVTEGASLNQLLTDALGQLIVVDKRRDIYFIDNVKFHVDEVQGLGPFVEIEAIDETGTIGEATLQKQCQQFQTELGIKEDDLVSHSYSDLLMNS